MKRDWKIKENTHAYMLIGTEKVKRSKSDYVKTFFNKVVKLFLTLLRLVSKLKKNSTYNALSVSRFYFCK